MGFFYFDLGVALNITIRPLEKNKRVLPEKLVFTEKDDEYVRIIVEMEDAPAIEEANQLGVKYSELGASKKLTLEKNALSTQSTVKKGISSVSTNVKYLQSFTTIFNGFSAEVQVKDVNEIVELDGVKAVFKANEYERPQEKPEMVYSKELVQAQQAWEEYGFKGEGMVVGIIDTGIDPSHQDMILTDDLTGEITEAEVEALQDASNPLLGNYHTAKVPYGYNYMDNNQEILDIGPDASMHGMHVGGTVAANGDEENGGLKGVAPEAQLLALKVFGNDPGFPSTFGDIYVKAIDDAIKLGADVLNLSLGSTAGFVDPEAPEQSAIKRAVESGILVAISAGNSDMFGSGVFYPYASNQDYGVTGSPSVTNESVGVASYENTKMQVQSLDYTMGEEEGSAFYLLANSADPTNYTENTVELALGGLGKPEELANVAGKFALVQRGAIGFVDKAKNAQAAGADGIIIYNNTTGIINMASDAAITIPQIFMSKADGDLLAAALTAGTAVHVTFNGESTVIDNPSAGSMSSFTSWGPTPGLDFKPEITAPGGQILSTLNNNQYGIMSGTSMAAPHVAGGSALILQRVDEEFNRIGKDRVTLAKNLLMNTSKPVELGEGEFVSPRRQGAGMMQLANALSTDVVVKNKATGEGKVALKEINDNEFSFTLEAENYSDEAVTYNVNVDVQTDAVTTVSGVKITAPNLIGSFVITEDIIITNDSTVTIPANGKVELLITVNVAEIDTDLDTMYPNGYFIDGYVTLTDANEEISGNVPLSVPFFGFNGSWDDAPLFDSYAWDSMTYYGYSQLLFDDGYLLTGTTSEGYDPSKFAFSPNGDNWMDSVTPLFTLMRNAKEIKVNVLDKDKKFLRTIRTSYNQTKNYGDSATNPGYKLNFSNSWNGQVNGKNVADGQYYLEVEGVIDFAGAEWQSVDYPIYVDTVAPVGTFTLNKATSEVGLTATDTNGIGVSYWEVVVNGEVVSGNIAPTEVKQIPKLKFKETDTVEVNVFDFAGNVDTEVLQEGKDIANPVINIDTPAYLQMYDTNQVVVSGNVSDESQIVELTINDEKVELINNRFTHTLVLPDGVHIVQVKAEDATGKIMEIARKVMVDTKDPVVKVDSSTIPNKQLEHDAANPIVRVTIKDNFDDIRVYLNDSEVFYNELVEPYEMRTFEKTLEIELPLKAGSNTFKVVVEDGAGNKVESKEFEVLKAFPPAPQSNGGFTPPAPPTEPGSVVVDEEDVKDQVSNPATTEVTIEAPAMTEAQPNVKAEIPASVLTNVVNSAKPLVVSTGGTEVQVPANVLKSIASSSPEKATVNVGFAKNSTIPSTGTNMSSVFEFSISVEKDGKTTKVSKFDQPIQVTVPVTASAKDARKVAAYYVNEASNKFEYVGGKLVDGKLVFKTNHFSKFVVIENNKTFTDVNKHWAQDEIEVLASRTITSGKTDTKFDPQGQITRAEFAVLIARALNLPMDEYQGTFSDVTKSKAWAYAGVEAAYEAGIVKGSSKTTFTPDALITREEIATMIVRAVKYQDEQLFADLDTSKSFADATSIGSFAKETVKQAAALGIVNGREGNLFNPKANATRAESAVMLYRSLEKLNEL